MTPLFSRFDARGGPLFPKSRAQQPLARPGWQEGIRGGWAHTARACSGVAAEPLDFFSFRLSILAAFRG